MAPGTRPAPPPHPSPLRSSCLSPGGSFAAEQPPEVGLTWVPSVPDSPGLSPILSFPVLLPLLWLLLGRPRPLLTCHPESPRLGPASLGHAWRLPARQVREVGLRLPVSPRSAPRGPSHSHWFWSLACLLSRPPGTQPALSLCRRPWLPPLVSPSLSMRPSPWPGLPGPLNITWSRASGPCGQGQGGTFLASWGGWVPPVGIGPDL